ncbi:YKOF domain-containing protein (fragment) [Oenococcus oeni]
MAKCSSLNPKSQKYAIELSSNIEQIFNYALSYAHKHIKNYVLEATILFNGTPLTIIK